MTIEEDATGGTVDLVSPFPRQRAPAYPSVGYATPNATPSTHDVKTIAPPTRLDMGGIEPLW